MRSLLTLPIIAILAIVMSAENASAGCCGAASYTRCNTEPASYGCAKRQCQTVMKTRKRVVYEKQQYTCYRTVYDTVYKDKVVNHTRYVRETHYRTRNYTVRKPVYETRYRT